MVFKAVSLWGRVCTPKRHDPNLQISAKEFTFVIQKQEGIRVRVWYPW